LGPRCARRRTLDLFLLLILPVALLGSWGSLAFAQEAAGAQKELDPARSDSEIVRDPSGIVSVKYQRGAKISVDNRTTGPIVVVGWDRDLIEASAVSDRGKEVVRANVNSDPAGKRIWLKADYSDALIPSVLLPTIIQALDLPLTPYIRPGEIFLEVKVPRYAEIDLITVFRSEVLVSGVETAITVSGEKSAITLRQVGSAEVRTRSGDVEVDGSDGLVDVITTSGAILVKNAKTDVRALSLSGRIEIQCARGRVDVSNTDGPIALIGIGGDATATSTNSNVLFSGSIRADGRYYLKSMSGSVEMEAPANGPGFTVTLSSYRGGVETDFSLKTNQSATNQGNRNNSANSINPSSPNNPANKTINHRLIGRYGNGQAQVTLDSFDGTVKLRRLAAGSAKECR
jgi:hypothetical protein